MAFDWEAFLEKEGIEYKTRGPSTSRGNLYVHCPFCGDADQGQHMGISVEGKGWGCWKQQAHRGIAPQRLVQALLKCSWGEAAKIVGKRVGGTLWGSPDALGQMLAGFTKPEEAEPPPPLELMDSFKPLHYSAPRAFVEYMLDRGLTKTELEAAAGHFSLHYALTGPYAYRVIFPVYESDRTLATWTGRAIGDAEIRYKTLSYREPGRPPLYGPEAHGPISNYLLDLPSLDAGGDFLAITEGPFDALNLWTHWPADGAGKVTCLFGKAISPAQLDRLAELRDRYRRVYLVLDPEANFDLLQATSMLSAVGVEPFYLQGESDPGDMSPAEASQLFRALARK